MKKVIFCGFGKLGKDCLQALSDNGYTVDYILTHQELKEDSVDTYAIKNNIPYSYKDVRKNLEELCNTIERIQPTYLTSVNYRYILPKEFYKIAKYAINIHGSLLPKYRGRTPHVWSIINGETVSGITAHIIEETVDTGDIIEQKSIDIEEDDTGYSLLEKYQRLYPELLKESLISIETEKTLTKQNNEEASYYGKRTPDMGYIDFYKKSADVINFVRAQAEPYPGAYYHLVDGRKIIINKIVIDKSIDLATPIGTIKHVSNSYYVKCEDNNLKIVDYRIIG